VNNWIYIIFSEKCKLTQYYFKVYVILTIDKKYVEISRKKSIFRKFVII